MACIDISKLKHSSILIHFVVYRNDSHFLFSLSLKPFLSTVSFAMTSLKALIEQDPILFQAKDVDNDFFPYHIILGALSICILSSYSSHFKEN